MPPTTSRTSGRSTGRRLPRAPATVLAAVLLTVACTAGARSAPAPTAPTPPGAEVQPVGPAGSGAVVPIGGAAFLQIAVAPASAVDLSAGWPRPTYPGPDRVGPAGGAVVTEVVRTGDFEANLTWTAGVAGELPFAVATLRDPPRLVVDVLHRSTAPVAGSGR